MKRTGRADGNYEARESSVKPKAVRQRLHLPSPGRLEGVGGLTYSLDLLTCHGVISTSLNDFTCSAKRILDKGEGRVTLTDTGVRRLVCTRSGCPRYRPVFSLL